MVPPSDSASTSAGREALLVFGQALALDLHQRRLPSSAAPLLDIEPLARAIEASGRDVHRFEHGPVRRRGRYRHAQAGADFGQRLLHAVATLRAAGYERIVIVGRDCPSLGPAEIELAFARLRAGEAAVLGPATDGGCYLIALEASHTDFLRAMPWQRGVDCARLRARFADLPFSELPVKSDLDSVLDLRRLAESLESAAALARRVLAQLTAVARRVAEFGLAVSSEPLAAARERLQLPPPQFV